MCVHFLTCVFELTFLRVCILTVAATGVCVCRLMCSGPLGCLSIGFAIHTTGDGKGGDPSMEERMEAQSSGKEKENSLGQEGGEGEGQSPRVRCCQNNSQQ